jgi:REP element-mobilizing transposase RayT
MLIQNRGLAAPAEAGVDPAGLRHKKSIFNQGATMSTHQQLLYHIVFSTKERRATLQRDEFRDQVFGFMAKKTRDLGGFAIIVGGHFDHAHLLIRIPAKIAVSDMVGQLKAQTSKHINETTTGVHKFGWQDGFGAFSVSLSQKDRVYQYIENQLEHHRAKTFQDEYLQLLEKHEVEYDPRYVWN